MKNNVRYILNICKSFISIPTYKSYRAIKFVKVIKYNGILYK